MRTLVYQRLDVFTSVPFAGNPLAVFLDGEGVDDATMQAIAREMNLSEIVFCLPPTDAAADVKLRIFTVDREIPLAGHPVVGTHHALATAGRYSLVEDGVTTVRAELGAGVLPAEIHTHGGDVERVVMTQRNPSFAPAIQDRELLAAALGIPAHGVGPGDLPARVVDTGIGWLIVPLVDRPAITAIAPRADLCRRVAEIAGTDMIYAFTQETDDPASVAKARHVWFGSVTPGEDPVTGSAAGCLASYLVAEGVVLAAPTAEIRIEQGAEVGRPGQVVALVGAEGQAVRRVQVGGRAIRLGQGAIWLA